MSAAAVGTPPAPSGGWDSLQCAALACLNAQSVGEKLSLTAAAVAADLPPAGAVELPEPPLVPGRPPRPALVSPRKLAQRGFGTPAGRAAFVHAIAHIEFNAINLAWDAVCRFSGMPAQYYRDWASVAADEARHFELLNARLADFGHAYGDFDAHDGLWQMALTTRHACLDRMALVPRVLEARGLDVTPAMIERLRQVGDRQTAEVLELILREEVRHVAIGTHWFRWCCERERLEPQPTFERLLRRHAAGAVRAPFSVAHRRDAGFTSGEIALLERISAEGA